MNSDKTVGPTGLANLRSWKPGQSGNPAGRPKRKTLAEMCGEELDEQARKLGIVITEEDRGRLGAKAWAAAIMEKNMRAISELADRRDGKGVERVEGVVEVAHVVRAQFDRWLVRDVEPEGDDVRELMPSEPVPPDDAPG